MTDSMVHLTSRVPQRLPDALEEMAKQRRKQTGEKVTRADLVREALENMVAGGSTDDLNLAGREFGALVLDTLEQLADEAERQGIEDAQDMALTLGVTAEKDSRTERLRAFVKKLHGTLRSV